MPSNFCFIKFLPKHTAEAPQAPIPPLHTLYPGGYRVKTPPRTFPLKDHFRAKFHPDSSSRLDFYREQTDRQTNKQTNIAFYVLDLYNRELGPFERACLDVFFKWAKPGLFLFISFFSHDKYSTKLTINYKSIDGMLGTQTQGGRMVGTDKSAELWRHQHVWMLIGFYD